MTAALALLLVNVVLGGWDTLWYHEHRARLTAKLAHTAPELRLHVVRDAVYAGLYGTLAWWRPTGWLVAVVGVGLTVEIGATLADFIVEDRDRPAIGGLAPGERVLHTLMAIVYGAMLCRLVPVLIAGATEPTGLATAGVPQWMSVASALAAVGIACSGTRDALALRGWDPIWSPRNRRAPAFGPRRPAVRVVARGPRLPV
jgi:hypothetical protein